MAAGNRYLNSVTNSFVLNRDSFAIGSALSPDNIDGSDSKIAGSHGIRACGRRTPDASLSSWKSLRSNERKLVRYWAIAVMLSYSLAAVTLLMLMVMYDQRISKSANHFDAPSPMADWSAR